MKSYKKLALGILVHDDHEKIETLYSVVDYITKADQFIIEKTLKNHRTFGYSTRKLEKAKQEGLVRSTQDQYQSNSKHPTGALNLREHQYPYLKKTRP